MRYDIIRPSDNTPENCCGIPLFKHIYCFSIMLAFIFFNQASTAPIYNQSVLISIVMSGLLDSTKVVTTTEQVSYQPLDNLLFSSFRQQYILGLQLAKLHPLIFDGQNYSALKLIAASQSSTISSSQAMARGILAVTGGLNLSNSYPDSVRPPGGYPIDSDSQSGYAVPPGLNIAGTTTFENEEDLALANYSSSCSTIDPDLQKAMNLFESSQTNLLNKFGLGNSNFQLIENYYLGLMSLIWKNDGTYPKVSNVNLEAWARGAILNYLGQINQHTEQMIKLITTQIYTHLDLLKNSSITESGGVKTIRPNAVILHVTPQIFHYVLALLNQTSRDCITKDLEAYFNAGTPENFTWSSNCEPYAPPSSILTISLAPNPSIEYNGRTLIFPSQTQAREPLSSLTSLLEWSLSNKNLEYYCVLDPSNLVSANDLYLLVYMISAVTLLLACITIYFVTVTNVKGELITYQFQKNQKLVVLQAVQVQDSHLSVHSSLGASAISLHRKETQQRLLASQMDN
jgi:hypothetical protein